MKTEIAAKLIVQHQKDKDRIAELQKTIEVEVKQRKERMAKIEAKLGEVINQSGKQGSTTKITAGGFTAYATESGKYSIPAARRGELDDWVLDPIAQAIDTYEGVERLQDALADVYDRLMIYTNKVNKAPIEEYRKETGGKEVEGTLKGGKLPAGVDYYLEKKVNIRKA